MSVKSIAYHSIWLLLAVLEILFLVLALPAAVLFAFSTVLTEWRDDIKDLIEEER